MTLSDAQCLHTYRMAQLIMYAANLNLHVKVVEWNRLLETQKAYVAKGVSKTMDSKHLVNCATDLYIIENGAPTSDMNKYRALGVYFEGLGGRWGGRFGVLPADYETKIGWDMYHMETKSS